METESGVSIHIVDAEYDTGPVIAQVRVPVEPMDTPETLAARVLQREHTFFAETLQKIVTEDIMLPRHRTSEQRNSQQIASADVDKSCR